MEKKLFIILFLLFMVSGPFTLFAENSPWHLDLNNYPLYIKTGFSASDSVNYPDASDSVWTVLAPAEKGGRLARILDLDFPHGKEQQMDFTFSIPFLMNIPRGISVPGIHLASLGDNWEIYLNGTLIRSAVDMNEEGQIKVHHSRRDIFFPIDRALFKEGSNLLVIHVICNPAYESTGFFQARPYYFDTFENINRANSSLLTIALLLLYLFMGIYHIFLFFAGRNYRYNLFYGLFSTTLSVYLFMRTHIVYLLIADTEIIFKIELISLFAILPTVSAFLQLMDRNRVNGITKGYSLFSLLLGLTVIFTPPDINDLILRIWQVASMAMILYIFLYLICWKFFSKVNRRWKRQTGAERSRSWFGVFLQTLSKTAIGNLFIGGIILAGTAIFDILDSMIFQGDLVLTNYGFLVFTLGSAFILANRFAFMNRQTARLNRSLEKKILEVEKASEQSKVSERKYRSLFEDHSDAVLLMNEDLSIIEANKAGMKLLGTDRKKLTSLNILASLTGKGNDTARAADLFRLKFREVLKSGKQTELNLHFSGKMGEIQAVRVRLELIKSVTTGLQILFRGVILQEDILLDYFIGERVLYKISNSFPLTEEVSRRITANLARYMDKGEAEILYIGLREIIINAVEHGNLHISFDEKTQAQAEGRYIEFLMERQKEKAFRDKKVKIEAAITQDKIHYRICDEGPGFNHRAFLDSTVSQQDVSLAHGRGIAMAIQLFDSVEYNEKGNEVTLVKKLKSI